MPNHVLSAQQFSVDQLEKIFALASLFKQKLQTRQGRLEVQSLYQGMVLATLFYEPSTRTRLSFESAAQRLGMGLISTENAAEFSSAVKGETIEDTIQVIDGYADVIVMRHKQNGAADLAAKVSGVPIINAGDGSGEHPTQSLLDAYTIYSEVGRLSELNVVIGGDLKHGRTARSLAKVLSLYPNNKITFVSTKELSIGDDIKEFLTKNNVEFAESDDISSAVKDADVIYWTRLQSERLLDKSSTSNYVIDSSVTKLMKKEAIILHPLPRVDEIHTDIDNDPRTRYFTQAENGLYVRMALIDYLNKGIR